MGLCLSLSGRELYFPSLPGLIPLTCCLFVQILEAFAAEDGHFVRNCERLLSLSSAVATMPQYEFRQICDTKLESISRRLTSYQEVQH